jgi:quercetin dioxygenase-like cupin family protein
MRRPGGLRHMALGAALALAGASLLRATPGVMFMSTALVRSTAAQGIHAMPNHLRIDDKIAPAQVNDVLIQKVVSPAGGSSGWHSHPGYGVVAIKTGNIEAYDADDPTCTPKIYGPGDVFTEMPGHVHFVRSLGPADYEAYAMFVLPVSAASRTDVPSPGNCAF